MKLPFSDISILDDALKLKDKPNMAEIIKLLRDHSSKPSAWVGQEDGREEVL